MHYNFGELTTYDDATCDGGNVSGDGDDGEDDDHQITITARSAVALARTII